MEASSENDATIRDLSHLREASTQFATRGRNVAWGR